MSIAKNVGVTVQIMGRVERALWRDVITKHLVEVAAANMEADQSPTRKRGGTCSRHSERIECTFPGCSNKRTSHTLNLCDRHMGRPPKKCSAPGCTRNVRNSGVCVAHGARICICSAEGCSREVRGRRNLCTTHNNLHDSARQCTKMYYKC